MVTTALTLAIAGVSALVKKAVDDAYEFAGNLGLRTWARVRADIKDRDVARAIIGITRVKTLWTMDREVSIYSFYYDSKVKFPRGEPKSVDSLNGFPQGRNYIIQGTAGQGKSIFLRYLCGQELRSDTSTGRIPILVELRRVNSDLGLEDLIFDSLRRLGLPTSEEAFDVYALSGKFVLLLDAFDEIDPDLQGRIVDSIECLTDLYSETFQIIVSSRPDSALHRSSRFRVCEIMPLGHNDHLRFLELVCIDKQQAHIIYRILQSSPTDILDLLTTPLMLTLLVILYRSQRSIPETVPKFYDELFDVLFYRHDRSKPGFRRRRYTELTDSEVKELFAGLCFSVRLLKPGVLSTSDFVECCRHAEKACDLAVDPLLFKDEIVKTVCLIREEGLELSFVHKSVTQYYSAHFIKNSGDDFARKFYQLMRRGSTQYKYWALELRFLSQIDSYRFATLFQSPLLGEFAVLTGVIPINGPTRENIAILADFLARVANMDSASLIDSQASFDMPLVEKLLSNWEQGIVHGSRSRKTSLEVALALDDISRRVPTRSTIANRAAAIRSSHITLHLFLADLKSMAQDAARATVKEASRAAMLEALRT